jgi:F-type H+-transporting ATPase subunit b
MTQIFENPEFWSAVAFVIVVLVALRPVRRFLNKWTDKQKTIILNRQKEADDILDKAKNLKLKYDKIYQDRWLEQKQMLEQADSEISLLKAEVEQSTGDKISRKNQEMAIRLKTIEENGYQNVKNKVLSKVISETKKMFKTCLNEDEVTENPDDLLETVFRVLKNKKELLKK